MKNFQFDSPDSRPSRESKGAGKELKEGKVALKNQSPSLRGSIFRQSHSVVYVTRSLAGTLTSGWERGHSMGDVPAFCWPSLRDFSKMKTSGGCDLLCVLPLREGVYFIPCHSLRCVSEPSLQMRRLSLGEASHSVPHQDQAQDHVVQVQCLFLALTHNIKIMLVFYFVCLFWCWWHKPHPQQK